MTKHASLNNITHKDLRVLPGHGAQFGDNVGMVLTFPTEFADIQREYPIFFRRDANTGEYQSVALLGFAKDENLFLEGDRWNARYIPGVIARGPFLIGVQEQTVDGQQRIEHMIHVDLDHPRISWTEGQAVFKPQGGNSEYLDHIGVVLRGIRQGIDVNKEMFAAFNDLGLIEPCAIDARLSQELGINVAGLLTINRSKLLSLEPEPLTRLMRAGFLEAAFLVLTSLNNVARLMALKRRALEQQKGLAS